MHYYGECHLNEAILKDAPVKFDRAVSVSTPDFSYHNQGYIDILAPGYYLLKWSTTSMTGFTQDGPWFELRRYDELEEEWLPIGNGSGLETLKNPLMDTSAGSGFIPFEVSDTDLEGPLFCFRIALFNNSGHSIALSRFPAAKASLMIFGVPYFDGEVSNLMLLLDQYEAECCGFNLDISLEALERMEMHQNNRLDMLEQFAECFRQQFDWYYIPEPIAGSGLYGGFPSPNWPGLLVYAMRTGYTHTFFMNGHLTGTPTVSSDGKRYFLTNAQYDPLNFFPSDSPFLVPLTWVQQGKSGDGACVAAWMDGTGIYYVGTPPSTETIVAWGFSSSAILMNGAGLIPCELGSD